MSLYDLKYVSKATGLATDSTATFSSTPRPSLGTTLPPIQWMLGTLFFSVKQPSHGVHQSLKSGVEIKSV